MSEAGPGYVHTVTKWLGLLIRTEQTSVAYKMLIGHSDRNFRLCLVLIEAEFISLRSLQFVIHRPIKIRLII
jgi:hypothetical protein